MFKRKPRKSDLKDAEAAAIADEELLEAFQYAMEYPDGEDAYLEMIEVGDDYVPIEDHPPGVLGEDEGDEDDEEQGEQAVSPSKRKRSKSKKKKKKKHKKHRKHKKNKDQAATEEENQEETDVEENEAHTEWVGDNNADEIRDLLTAANYMSDDSLDRMVEQRNRFSRYTAMDDDDFQNLPPIAGDDRYTANPSFSLSGAGGGTTTTGAGNSADFDDNSEPAQWRSWDQDEQEEPEPMTKNPISEHVDTIDSIIRNSSRNNDEASRNNDGGSGSVPYVLEGAISLGYDGSKDQEQVSQHEYQPAGDMRTRRNRLSTANSRGEGHNSANQSKRSTRAGDNVGVNSVNDNSKRSGSVVGTGGGRPSENDNISTAEENRIPIVSIKGSEDEERKQRKKAKHKASVIAAAAMAGSKEFPDNNSRGGASVEEPEDSKRQESQVEKEKQLKADKHNKLQKKKERQKEIEMENNEEDKLSKSFRQNDTFASKATEQDEDSKYRYPDIDGQFNDPSLPTLTLRLTNSDTSSLTDPFAAPKPWKEGTRLKMNATRDTTFSKERSIPPMIVEASRRKERTAASRSIAAATMEATAGNDGPATDRRPSSPSRAVSSAEKEQGKDGSRRRLDLEEALGRQDHEEAENNKQLQADKPPRPNSQTKARRQSKSSNYPPIRMTLSPIVLGSNRADEVDTDRGVDEKKPNEQKRWFSMFSSKPKNNADLSPTTGSPGETFQKEGEPAENAVDSLTAKKRSNKLLPTKPAAMSKEADSPSIHQSRVKEVSPSSSFGRSKSKDGSRSKNESPASVGRSKSHDASRSKKENGTPNETAHGGIKNTRSGESNDHPSSSRATKLAVSLHDRDNKRTRETEVQTDLLDEASGFDNTNTSKRDRYGSPQEKLKTVPSMATDKVSQQSNLKSQTPSIVMKNASCQTSLASEEERPVKKRFSLGLRSNSFKSKNHQSSYTKADSPALQVLSPNGGGGSKQSTSSRSSRSTKSSGTENEKETGETKQRNPEKQANVSENVTKEPKVSTTKKSRQQKELASNRFKKKSTIDTADPVEHDQGQDRDVYVPRSKENTAGPETDKVHDDSHKNRKEEKPKYEPALKTRSPTKPPAATQNTSQQQRNSMTKVNGQLYEDTKDNLGGKEIAMGNPHPGNDISPTNNKTTSPNRNQKSRDRKTGYNAKLDTKCLHESKDGLRSPGQLSHEDVTMMYNKSLVSGTQSFESYQTGPNKQEKEAGKDKFAKSEHSIEKNSNDRKLNGDDKKNIAGNGLNELPPVKSQQQSIQEKSQRRSLKQQYKKQASPTHGDTKKNLEAQPTELDEFTFPVDIEDEAPLVQCLKFYNLNSAAAVAGVLISSTDCRRSKPTHESFEIQMLGSSADEIDIQRLREKYNSQTPKVEVVLDEGQKKPTWNLSNDGDDETIEAPNIGRSKSYVKEITGMRFHLDEDRDAAEATTMNRRTEQGTGRGMTISSIEIPAKKPAYSVATVDSYSSESREPSADIAVESAVKPTNDHDEQSREMTSPETQDTQEEEQSHGRTEDISLEQSTERILSKGSQQKSEHFADITFDPSADSIHDTIKQSLNPSARSVEVAPAEKKKQRKGLFSMFGRRKSGRKTSVKIAME